MKTAVHIDTQLYNSAAVYARQHDTSIDKMVEAYMLTLLSQAVPQTPSRGIAYQQMMRRLSDFQEYEQGWDGDDARPLNTKVVKNFKQVLEESTDSLLADWTIFPAANGSLLLEYKPKQAGINIGKDDFSFYCLNEGQLEGENGMPFTAKAILDTMKHISND